MSISILGQKTMGGRNGSRANSEHLGLWLVFFPLLAHASSILLAVLVIRGGGKGGKVDGWGAYRESSLHPSRKAQNLCFIYKKRKKRDGDSCLRKRCGGQGKSCAVEKCS
jgi:hypothetical protein